jgi:2-polyprenyl-3-methyl-5-hydroxy-6-metoxy-1,4-benzoquinol methylase
MHSNVSSSCRTPRRLPNTRKSSSRPFLDIFAADTHQLKGRDQRTTITGCHPTVRRPCQMPTSLSRRNRQPELMDQPGLLANDHKEALAGLARLNWLSGSNRILWPPLRKLARLQAGQTVRVLDLACGSGDVTIALANRARREKCQVEFVGCDVSEVALSVARANAQESGQSVEFFQANVLESELPAEYDAVICSLFLHHLADGDAEALLRRVSRAARRLVLVNDLVRSRGSYLLAVLASRLLTRSPIVRVDGPLSVEGAFTPAEALAMATRAELAGAAVSRHWPARFLLQWWKP